ncbi:MAG TPA: IscS subfamily cysteine desulfurase [Ignavibacteriales bacterium]|nr:IscS subfamily cysteine desulfurase [Ignavibacteriales bacterium]
MNNKIIYFDNNATTRTDDRVVEAMLPYFSSYYANPSSLHSLGQTVKQIVETSRSKISSYLSSKPEEIIFTSGATEAINLAIKGIVETYSNKGRHIITSQTEHSAVLDVCKYLESRGFEIDYLRVSKEGLIDLTQLENQIRTDTILVAIMYVNNETGVVQPIAKIAEICNLNKVLFFTDATQAVGKLPINTSNCKIDLLCFSGHKFYGPKGIGGLYCKRNIKLNPLLHGGGHENGLRSGTLNVPGIVGLSKAFEIAHDEMQTNKEFIQSLRDKFERIILSQYNVKLNGHPKNRLYNVSNMSFKDIDPLLMISSLNDIAFSQGSACSSSSIKPSHVLTSMGVSYEEAFSSFRFSFGKYNSESEVDSVLSQLGKILKQKEKSNTII